MEKIKWNLEVKGVDRRKVSHVGLVTEWRKKAGPDRHLHATAADRKARCRGGPKL